MENKLQEKKTSTYWAMVSKKKSINFNDLENYPDLKESFKPAIKRIPSGSMTTKIIINEGVVVERIYETPKGEIISLIQNEISKDAA